jgi:hypothetical protein
MKIDINNFYDLKKTFKHSLVSDSHDKKLEVIFKYDKEFEVIFPSVDRILEVGEVKASIDNKYKEVRRNKIDRILIKLG